MDARIRTVQTLQACYNCLGLDHNSWQCYSKRTCKECGKKHHTLPHKPIAQTTSEGKASTSMIVATQLTGKSSLAATIPQQTALVCSCQVMLDVNGKKQQVRAMIDPGSTLSFVTGRITTALRATRIPFTTSISGLNQSHAATSFFKIDTTLNSWDDNEMTPIKMTPSVVTSTTSITPASDITKNTNIGFTKDLRLADPEFGTPGKIDLLIGQDVLHEILKGGIVHVSGTSLYAINTVFGWVIGGKCDSPDQAVTAHIFCKANADNDTEKLLKAFWESEDPPSMVSGLSPEEQSALDYFQDTVTQEDVGRYRVCIPKKENSPSLGYSKPQAGRRYEQNYKTLVRKGRWTDFEEAVDEYSKLRHSELVPASDLSKTPDQAYYMGCERVKHDHQTACCV